MHAEMVLPKTRPTRPMPAVIWIHGGGWKGGNHIGNPAGFLASYGYVGVSIEYRLTTEALWPAQIEDCKLGVRWLRANAATYDVDPDRIGCWGHSAGGQLVSLLGTTDAKAGFEGDGGYAGVSGRVSAVVDAAGPNDPTRFPTWAPEVLFGKDRAKDTDLLKKASPLYWVGAGDPPFLIIHGDQDKSVPIEASMAFKEALQKARVPVQMVIVKGGDHGFSAPSPSAPPPQPDKKGIQAIILHFFDVNLKGAAAATGK